MFRIFPLIWWADFNLTRHERWTFPVFLCTLLVPAALYAASALILPSDEVQYRIDMRTDYDDHRPWFFSLVGLSIALSFAQSYLLEGRIPADADAVLKGVFLIVSLVPICESRYRSGGSVRRQSGMGVSLYLGTFLQSTLLTCGDNPRSVLKQGDVRSRGRRRGR